MANIEETIFDQGLPVNSIAMANRLIEILKANKTNGYGALPDKDKVRYRMCLWLINGQVFGSASEVDMYKEWNELVELWDWEKKKDKFKAIKGPKALCTCGHSGDGENSMHHDKFAPGHGACRVPGCECEQFVWGSWLPSVMELLNKE